jgi:hypothetical protein
MFVITAESDVRTGADPCPSRNRPLPGRGRIFLKYGPEKPRSGAAVDLEEMLTSVIWDGQPVNDAINKASKVWLGRVLSPRKELRRTACLPCKRGGSLAQDGWTSYRKRAVMECSTEERCCGRCATLVTRWCGPAIRCTATPSPARAGRGSSNQGSANVALLGPTEPREHCRSEKTAKWCMLASAACRTPRAQVPTPFQVASRGDAIASVRTPSTGPQTAVPGRKGVATQR